MDVKNTSLALCHKEITPMCLISTYQYMAVSISTLAKEFEATTVQALSFMLRLRWKQGHPLWPTFVDGSIRVMNGCKEYFIGSLSHGNHVNVFC